MPVFSDPSRFVSRLLTVALLAAPAGIVPARADDPPAAAPTASSSSPAPTVSPAALPRQEHPRLPSGTPLDATPAEIAKFYGPVLKANARVHNHRILEGTILDGDLYGKNGLIIRVVYYRGRSVLLEYTRANGPLTLADANPLLTVTAGNSSWETGKDSTDTNKFYRRLDDKAIAHWTSATDGSLLVSVEDNPAFGGGMIH